MSFKTKVAISICVAIIVGGGAYIVINHNNDTKDPSTVIEQDKKPTIDSDKKEEDTAINKDNSKLEQQDVNNNESFIFSQDKNTSYLEITSNNKKPNVQKPSEVITPGEIEKPVEPEIPMVPEKPTVPTVPEDPKEPDELEDLVITNDMVKDGTITITNKRYNTLTIASDIDRNVRIMLDTIEVQNEMVLENPKNYQLDIVNSSLPSLIVANYSTQVSSYALRSRSFAAMNKAIEGPTINLKDGSTVQSVSIDGDVQINGDTYVEDIEVFSGSEVVLNIPSKNVSLNTQGVVAINQAVNTLVNTGVNATIVVNAPITTLSNNESSTIRINQGNTITSFKNQGENTVVSGNGTITNSVIEANDTRIYTNVTNPPVIRENIDNVLIRKESQVEIESIYSNAQGSVTFTLSEVTKLTLNDISVICNAGKSITLFNLTTADNKTYTLTTSYYKNDSYALYITLPNGNIISKDFDTDYANPTVNNVVIERTSNTEATLELYGVDEGGYVYYVLEDATSREIMNSETLKEKGQMGAVKVGYNMISIKDLEPGKAYNLYYVLEGYFDNISKVKGPFEVSENVKEVSPSDYKITYAKEEMINRFVFTLNKAPKKELTLEDFEIKCPKESNLTTTGANFIVSPDRLTYILIVPDNYGHGDNKYTVKIKISETEMIEGSFVSHFNPPVITGAVDNVSRIDENTAKFTFNSDEAGTVYYGVYEWNGAIYDYNSTTPFATDVFTGKIESKQQALNAGPNTIMIDLTGITTTKNTRVWALFVDTVGNYRFGFVDHYKLPSYVESEQPNPSQSSLKITNFEVLHNNYFIIDFNEQIDWVSSDDIQLAVVENGSLPSKLLYVIDNDTPNHLTITTQNYTLPTGTYELTINTKDKNGTSVSLVKRFEISNN